MAVARRSRSFFFSEVFVVSVVFFLAVSAQEDLRYPRQVHLSLGVDPSSMVVTWTTFQSTNGSVQYSLTGSGTWMSVPAKCTVFVDGGSEHRKLYIFRATMPALKPTARYDYRVGDMDGGWSDLFFFKGPQTSPNWSPVLAIYGDLGNANGRSIGRLQTEAQFGSIDAVIHNGDFAYNMEDNNARTGDQFMDQIQPIAGYIPYMTSPGNHEQAYNFSNYRNRFTMPGGDGEGFWYSFDYGPAHFISINTEVYFYFEELGKELIYEQKLWLQKDLEKANKNRAERPWIILYGHKPMYCSNNDRDDCTWFESLIRYAFEDQLYKAGVDIVIWAHEHSYERLWPVYNRRVCNGTEEAYTEPRAPVHIITGSAGMWADHDPFTTDKPEWSAFRTLNYGYSRFRLHNSTHITIEQVDDEQDGKIVDMVTVIKTKHGPGYYDCHLSKEPRF